MPMLFGRIPAGLNYLAWECEIGIGTLSRAGCAGGWMAERLLRILQVNTSDIQGGAAKVAWNLFCAYRARGHYSRLAVGIKHSADPDVVAISNEQSRGNWYRFFQYISRNLRTQNQETPFSRLVGIMSEPSRRMDLFCGIEDFHFPSSRHLLQLDGALPDVLHAHNLHGAYFDLRLLPRLSHQVPLLLTLHDGWMLSGHCAHSFGCERWKIGCGQCPDLGIYPAIQRDATALNWRRKRDIFLRSRLFVATPSHWLMKRVEESLLAPAIVKARVIPNGVDLEAFHPTDVLVARARLGIPPDTRVLLTVGVSMRESIWRDFQMLREAIIRASRLLPREQLLLMVLGEEAQPERYENIELRFVPFHPDSREVACYYQASDIYLHTARVDTFPSSVLEALACGTPVIATSVGGIPEQVEEGHTGYLVPVGNAEQMATKIVELLENHDLRMIMQKKAAAHAQGQFGLERQVNSYLDWYHEMTVDHK